MLRTPNSLVIHVLGLEPPQVGFFYWNRAVMACIMNGLTAAQALQIKRERDDSDDSKWDSIADIF